LAHVSAFSGLSGGTAMHIHTLHATRCVTEKAGKNKGFRK
jgi:hypothetical protein